MLKILMIGAGGIGGYYAARLAEARHDVVLTARGEHLAALKANGLTVDYQGQILKYRLTTYGHAELIRACKCDDFDLIAIALKSTATEPVMAELSDWLQVGTVPVLSLQNGVDNEPAIANVVGEMRVLGGLAVRIGGHIVGPGEVFAEGVAQIVLGAWPTQQTDDPRADLLKMLEIAFNEAGIPTTVSDNIRYQLWRKLVINNGVNPLSALTGLDTRSLTHHPEFGKVVYGMMAETVTASKADGVNLTKNDLDDMFELISNFNAIKTSMLVDKEKGRPLELDSIAGAVLRRCERLGVEAPYTFTVNALLRQ
ncbi:MAG: 2-dehydropantoate 2-reductase [Marinobacter excellens HL-55]|uniref:2-dehydropantoate 2-reductase n=1 Tax=Marinobacter excellens HL-55 TaxID=1305731 RepID=A0A0P7Y9H5_9GAMM|nr:MAG: 2-dehydropantoate 2-reductase [Marinobacter excellens HL-55]